LRRALPAGAFFRPQRAVLRIFSQRQEVCLGCAGACIPLRGAAPGMPSVISAFGFPFAGEPEGCEFKISNRRVPFPRLWGFGMAACAGFDDVVTSIKAVLTIAGRMVFAGFFFEKVCDPSSY